MFNYTHQKLNENRKCDFQEGTERAKLEEQRGMCVCVYVCVCVCVCPWVQISTFIHILLCVCVCSYAGRAAQTSHGAEKQTNGRTGTGAGLCLCRSVSCWLVA